jgi:surface polysaccharide O-acyltransferase-like enzyme
MYLGHMLILGSVATWICSLLGRGAQGLLGIWTTPVEVLAIAVISFTASAILCVLIQKIPRIGKYIVG